MGSLVRRLATRVANAASHIAPHGRALVGLAVVVLLPLAAYGCGGQSPDSSEIESRPWREPIFVGNTNFVGLFLHAREPCISHRDDEDYGPHLYEHFIHWSPDGSHLVFDVDNTIWTLDVEGVTLLELAEVDPESSRFGFYADVSPDVPRIVYTTCEYPLDGYEIATVNMDGTGKRRLTEDGYFDHYPVWSPDGSRIAFVSHRLTADPKTREDPDYSYLERLAPDAYPVRRYRDQRKAKLTILRVEKSLADRLVDVVLRRGDVSRLEETARLALSPPVWSPDSEYLAFIANAGSFNSDLPFGFTRVVHTVREDGSRLARIGETTALPTWSPDGDDLAYATVDGDVPALYAVRPDGTGRRLIWSGGADEGFAPISQVLWSPDGSEILFFSNESYLVRPDGGGLRRLGIPRHVPDARAAWSPDGSRIAIYFPYLQIVTVSRDGTEVLIHAEADHAEADIRELSARDASFEPLRPHFRALDPPLAIALPYRSDCSSAVPDPDANPGLVRDCETLLRIRTALFGLGPAGTGRKFEYRPAGSAWREDMPIWTWAGVSVGGDPPRVRKLLLWREVRGPIPPDIANLEMLEVLSIFDNDVTGPIPPELGRLTNLESLSISQNLISGGIPPELGALKNLTVLDLSGNSLSGGIPPELGALTNLTYLDLSKNYGLSGDIPAELGALTRLKTLNLSGSIGCIPVELPVLWVLASGLEYCKPKGEDGS